MLKRINNIYLIGFILLAVFCYWTYGDVYHHIALDNFVCSDAEAMTFVRRQSLGMIYWVARYALIAYKLKWLGAILMAAILTLSAWLIDRCIPRRWSEILKGVGFLPVFALLSWMVYRGYNLFLRCEISTFVVWTLSLLFLAFILGICGTVVRRFNKQSASPIPTSRIPFNLIAFVVLYGGLTWQAIVPGENVRMACRMQNLLDYEEWDEMADIARSCRQPSRSVAAYYTIALVQQNQLLEHIFDIPFNYPHIDLDDLGGTDEGVNYIADCNLFAGLPNAAYHISMENHVMFGPRLRNYKRMAICSILSLEPELAKRYLHIIGQVPFEKTFVERYLPFVGHPELLVREPVFNSILTLSPREKRFEQNYRQPVFLGYNAGLLSGSDATLVTSVATCMYSKDLNNLLLRTNFLQQKMSLPLVVQQSIAIASLNREGLLDSYPQVKANTMLMAELQRFVADAQPYTSRQRAAASDEEKNAIRAEMAEALRDQWLGSYYYYYYCGNIDQTVKQTQSHGVN